MQPSRTAKRDIIGNGVRIFDSQFVFHPGGNGWNHITFGISGLNIPKILGNNNIIKIFPVRGTGNGRCASALTALVAGTLFGLGLAISQMTNPAKVLAFLDIAGDWDPSLAFVMAGAVAVSFVAFRVARTRHTPLLGDTFRLPTRRDIDAPLVVGALLFGVGWGLAGLCPGPAITAVLSGSPAHASQIVSVTAGAAAAASITLTRAKSIPTPQP